MKLNDKVVEKLISVLLEQNESLIFARDVFIKMYEDDQKKIKKLKEKKRKAVNALKRERYLNRELELSAIEEVTKHPPKLVSLEFMDNNGDESVSEEDVENMKKLAHLALDELGKIV